MLSFICNVSLTSSLCPRLGVWRWGRTQDTGEALSTEQAGSPENGSNPSCTWLCPSLLPAWRARSRNPAWPLPVPGKQARSMLLWSSRPGWTHVCERDRRGRRAGKAAGTSHSQHANTDHFSVKSFSNGERRDLPCRPPPGVVHLPQSHLNRTSSQTQMENKTTREKNVLHNSWKLLTASVKYMKFW